MTENYNCDRCLNPVPPDQVFVHNPKLIRFPFPELHFCKRCEDNFIHWLKAGRTKKK